MVRGCRSPQTGSQALAPHLLPNNGFLLRLPQQIAILATVVVAILLSGCAADWTQPRPAPTFMGSPGAGFEPSSTPSPEATINPTAGSWDGVHPTPGLRVVLLTAGDEPPTVTLTASVTNWARQERVDLRTIPVGDHPIDGIVKAIEMNPDLIVSVGNDLVDALATVTASHLDTQFLVVGAEIAEPTVNVTAVDWVGASFRGEGLVASSPYDPESFTPKRCDAAIRAGVAAVLTRLTGIVIWID